MVESRDDRTVVAGGSDSGWGGGGMIGMLMIFLLLAGGGMWGNRGNDAARETELVNANMNSRFNSLESMNEFRYLAQANNINHIEALESTRDLNREICTTRSMVQQVGHENALIAKNAELEALKCCCTTQSNIADAKNEILGAIKANEIQTLRDKLYEVQNGLSSCNQTAAIINAVRPYPAPSYVTYNPQQSYFPPTPAIPAAQAYGMTAGCAANPAYGF